MGFWANKTAECFRYCISSFFGCHYGANRSNRLRIGRMYPRGTPIEFYWDVFPGNGVNAGLRVAAADSIALNRPREQELTVLGA